MKLNSGGEDKEVELSYVVKNFVTAPGKGLRVNLAIAGQITLDIEAEISGK